MRSNLAKNHSDTSYQTPRRENPRNAICLCADRRMLIPALFVADSIQAHSKSSDKQFDLLVFSEPSEVTDSHRQWMEQRGILLHDDMDMSGLRGVGKFSERLSTATLMKLSLAEHLAGQYDKILYLDCDLTIHDDVAAIFSLDTAPFALAATPSGRILEDLSKKARKEMEDSFHTLGMSKPYRFFNTGVLYIDVAIWNRENLGHRTLDFIRQNPDLCRLPDEHGLNAVLNGTIAQLSPIWNTRPPPRWRKDAFGFASPVIIHHAGPIKPWRRFSYGRALFPDLAAYRLYQDFLRDTPWVNWLGQQWSWHDFYLNVRGEAGRLARRLAGRLEEPTAEQRKAYIEALRRFYADETFADVEQRVAIREHGKIRLNTGKRGRIPYC